jgi:hypothetical protein
MKRFIMLTGCLWVLACAGTAPSASPSVSEAPRSEVVCEPCSADQLGLLQKAFAKAASPKVFVLTDGTQWYLSWTVQDSVGFSVSQSSYASFDVLLRDGPGDIAP